MWKLTFCALVLVTWKADLILGQAASTISNETELCSSVSEIHLSHYGDTTSQIISLSPTEHNSFCKLRVTAPKTHAISMHFMESTSNGMRDVRLNKTDTQWPQCVMSIILPDNPRVPVWKGDICSKNSLSQVDLLTSDFKIIWNPPPNPVFARGRKFVLTAVGQGEICKEPGQHACMRIGWDPLLCVSDTLLCNGVQNCPKSSTTSDEDEKLCKKSFFAPTSLEQLAVELYKKFKHQDLAQNNKWIQGKGGQFNPSTAPPKHFNWRDWNDRKTPEASSTTPKPVMEKKPKATDSVSQVLSKYGPWGYLMLGMLICGTVLMFCGLWECCFRKPKSDVDTPLPSQPTTVLIINPNEENPPSPPNYDDLDQPPSYTTLFPNKIIATCSARESEPQQNNTQQTVSNNNDDQT